MQVGQNALEVDQERKDNSQLKKKLHHTTCKVVQPSSIYQHFHIMPHPSYKVYIWGISNEDISTYVISTKLFITHELSVI